MVTRFRLLLKIISDDVGCWKLSSSVAGGDIGRGPNLNYDLTVGGFLETLCIS